MRRIVLDTNCLLQSLPTSSPYHKIWTDVIDGHIQLCVNTEILNEYEEILSKKTTKEIGHSVVEAIARLSTNFFQESYFHFGLITADPDDNKFVDCKLESDEVLECVPVIANHLAVNNTGLLLPVKNGDFYVISR